MADHSHDVDDEQTRNVLMAPMDGQDLHKDLDQAKEYVGSAAHVGAANHGVVALAPPPTTRRDRMRHLALIGLTALSRDDPQQQLAPISATGKQGPPDISLTEINVRKLRLQVAPLLGVTASTFCVAMIPFQVLTKKRSLTTGGYGRVYTAQWNDNIVVIKKFRGEEAEKNASRELGQVQLGRVSSYVVALVGFTWWVSDTGERTPCLVYPYAGTTLWALISDQDRHPLANPLDVCAELCNAVHSLHADSGMLHLDLKGDNVIVRTRGTPVEYKVRLIDLGTSQPVGDNHNPYLQQGRNKSNEKHWFAPEWEHDAYLTPHTDTWALGYLLADCLIPLGGGKYHTVAPSPGLISKKFDAEVEGIVLRCFNIVPRFRPSLVALKTLFKAKRSPIMNGLP